MAELGFVGVVQWMRGGQPWRGNSACRRARRRGEVRAASEDAGDVLTPDSMPDLSRALSPVGEDGCEQCAGKGSIECPVCAGKGFISMEMFGQVSSSQCRLCNGRKIVPCPTCKRIIYKSIIWWDMWKERDMEQGQTNDEKKGLGEEKGPDEDDDPNALPNIRWNDPPF
eukprot:Plantae.Rhodophyta-Purpureofilum_apyrenoidigerum.ctg9471.p1 GENE.Plantae.Rhodophyta-Purpureofilum_apyrenoidigerum.ctg9471~~Plantae.Rhodophyta-Purpureofilum_apyrenoidigerum.ctg9471.p1  ORF type:complete len:169 (-),score=17.48 Plantae.Rhodophyta-Purpureofilum_apyrenoidigerum.ctg9471:546-1052(-)